MVSFYFVSQVNLSYSSGIFFVEILHVVLKKQNQFLDKAWSVQRLGLWFDNRFAVVPHLVEVTNMLREALAFVIILNTTAEYRCEEQIELILRGKQSFKKWFTFMQKDFPLFTKVCISIYLQSFLIFGHKIEGFPPLQMKFFS